MMRAESDSVNTLPLRDTQELLAEHIGSPVRASAREAKAEYIRQLFRASLLGHDVDREAADWYAKLVELCGPYKDVEVISDWYVRESRRLLRLADALL